MGGLLIADAARDIAANTREGDPMWPRIVEIIAFDTPVRLRAFHRQIQDIYSGVSWTDMAVSGLASSMFPPLLSFSSGGVNLNEADHALTT